MKKFLSFLAMLCAALMASTVQAQVTQITDYAMFSGNGGPGTTNPGASGYGVILGSSTNINGGNIGSYALVQTTGGASFSGNIYSGGKVILANGNSVTGRITAANSAALSGTIFQAGSSQILSGNIDVNGNIVVGSGTVTGIVTHPTGTTYTGPNIGANNHVGTPSLPTLPALLPVTTFPAAGSTNITNNQTITPGNYGAINLNNNKTLTFNGPGVYVFSAITLSSNNNFVFNFQNLATGTFQIYVYGDVNLGKLNASTTNGGGPSRIFMETHGTGSTSSTGKDAVSVANGSSGGSGSVKFKGTIWAPYGAISIGSGTGSSSFEGALYSGTQVLVQTGVTLNYYAYSNCTPPVANAGNDVNFCAGGNAQLGAAPVAGNSYSWSPTTNLSSSTIANPTVTSSTSGNTTYTVTVTSGACVSTDQVGVTVYALPAVNAGTYAAVCVSGSAVTLSGTPSGGTFSGPGVTGNSFNPSTAGTGTKTITYSYTDSHGCSNSATTSIVVNALPVVSAGTYSPVCVNVPSVTLSGSPSGGTFSGPGVTGNSFNPSTAGAGSRTVTYTYNNGQCSNTANATIVVNALPDVNAGLDGQLDCSTPTTTLHGSSSTPGAAFSWTASNGGSISANANSSSPTINAHGTFTLTVTSPAGCSASDVAQVIFDPCIFPGYDPVSNGKTGNIIGSELTSLYGWYQTHGCGNPNLDIYITNDNCQVLVEIIYEDGMLQQLYNILIQPPYNITDTIDNGSGNRILTTFIDLGDLQALNDLNITTGLNLINHVRPVFRPIPTAGVAYTLGDIAQGSDAARSGFNVRGEGIKVGVISNSYNTVAGNHANLDVLNGDLPGVGNPDGDATPVQVIQDYPYGPQSDEGRAMLQIVHDVAPKATLAFATGFISAGNMAQKIRLLQQAGCDIEVDDITYITEPFFSDGMIANAVNEVTAQGVTYFTSAGNYGDKSYEGIYTPTTAPGTIVGTAHDFGGGDRFQNISLTPGSYLVVMQWEDDFYSIDQQLQGTANDLDIYLTYDNGITLFGFNRNNIGGDPIEVLPFTVTQNTTTNILITRETGSGIAVHFKYIVFKVPAGGFVANEYNQGNSTIVGQANSLGAITCGAVLYSNTPAYGVNPPTKASFSSVGGTLTYGSQRNKPDICAPNGGNTTVDLGGPNIDLPAFPLGDAFPNFYGTSAAAPHAAGVGALIQSAKIKYYGSDLTPAQVKNLLTSTATDMYGAGFDYLSGYGMLNADLSMRTFAAPTPVLVSLDVPNGVTPGAASFTLTVTADFITTQSQIVFRDIHLTTTWLDEHHLSAQIPAFFGNPPITVCTPGIAAPAYLDGGCSNTLYFFTPVKRNVVVSAENKTKKFGEKLPVFTPIVTVDGQSLQAANLTLADLGLDNIQYALPLGTNSMSPVGIYFINPSAGPFDIGLTELYNYTFNTTSNNNPGLLTIQKMPLVIKPVDKTVLYGDKIDGRDIDYTYIYDATNIAPVDQATFLNDLKNSYEPGLVKEVALIDDRDVYNNATLSVADLQNLALLSGSKGIANGSHGIANGSRGIANNQPYPDTTYVIDLPYQSLVNYNNNGTLITLENSILLLNGSHGIANGSRGIANSMAIADGSALVNGSHPIANGSRGIANGSHGIVNSEELDGVSNTNTAVIIHESDLDTQENPDSTFQMLSINGITGLTAGAHWIIPGAFMSSNFEVTYDKGALNINPFEIKIDANDASTVYGTAPSYSAVISGYQYDDTAPVVFSGALSFTPAFNSQINVGTHTIVPGGVSLVQPTNYYITYVNGSLSVTPATLTITADSKSPACSSLPTFTSTITGYRFSDAAANVLSVLPSYTVWNNQQQVLGIPPAGTYQIVPGGAQLITPSNYTIQYVNGTLIEPAALTMTATATQPACYNQFGSVTLHPVGGTTPYNYSGSALTNLGAGSYNYTVTDGHGCTANASATIIVPSQITASTSLTPSGCTTPTGTATVSAGGGTPPYTYLWSPGGQTNATATNLAIGAYTVVITDAHACTKSATVSVGATQSVPVAPVWHPNGSDNPVVGACGGSSYEYEIYPSSGATSYTWSAPAGSVISDGLGHSGNPLTFAGLNAGGEWEVYVALPSGFISGNITVYASNACGNSATSTLAIQSKPNAPGPISGQTTGLCNASNKVYSIAAVPGATSYTWTKPSGTTISGSSNGTSITLSYGSSFTGTGTITVKANNSCGSSAVSSLAVDAKPAQPGSITGSTSVCKSQASVSYSIAAVSGATSYTWTISGGATFVGGSTGSSVTVKYTTASSTTATMTVKANNSCGSSVTRSLTIAVNLNCRTGGQNDEASGSDFNVFPNPTSEKATVSFVASEGNAATLDVYDLNGALVSHVLDGTIMQSGPQSVEIDCSSLVKGIYFVRLTVEQETSLSKLVIIK